MIRPFRFLVVFLAASAGQGAPVFAEEGPVVLEAARLHAGEAGQWEWEKFKDVPVTRHPLEWRFSSKANAAARSVRIRQSDVKLGWPVLLNGRVIGALATAETAMDLLLPILPGALKDGENILKISPPPGLDDIEIGPIVLLPDPVAVVLGACRVKITVTDAADHQGMPCRLTLTSADGALQPLLAEPAGEVSVRTGVCYSSTGTVTFSLPGGHYILHAGRGFEWGIARSELHLTPGNNPPVALQLTREVPTPGWIAADSHIHTLTHSGHGDATLADRVLTIAGEGIELAVATDHNHHTDLTPSASGLGLLDRFTPVVGNEVTTPQGHFNAFPIELGARGVPFHRQSWDALLPSIRAIPGVKVITLNHPRDVHSGFTPFGPDPFDSRTGAHRESAAMEANLDAVEVITSAAMQSDISLLYRDWFALLNRGLRPASIGSSDSHDVNRYILGQGRTYVAVDDANPAHLDMEMVWQSYQKGRLLVSMGLLAHLKVEDRFTVGDLATGVPQSIKVEAVVLGPSWVKADHIALYANGLVIREQAIEDPFRPGEKARIVWQIPRPGHDVHLVVIATGPGVTEPFWEIPRPYQAASKTFTPKVIGSTNPIWLDADGDGRFRSARDYARTLAGSYPGDPAELRQALEKYDHAVQIQVESIRERWPD